MKRFTRQHFLSTALLCALCVAPVLGQAAPRDPNLGYPSTKPGQVSVNWNYAFYGLNGVPGYSIVVSAYSSIVSLPGCGFQACGVGSWYRPSYNSSQPYPNPYIRIP